MAVVYKIRVLLVDDHSLVRQGLRSVLEAYDDIEVVGEAGDGEAAVLSAARLEPTAVVMDINMSKMDGITATRLIKKQNPEIAVAVNVDGFVRLGRRSCGLPGARCLRSRLCRDERDCQRHRQPGSEENRRPLPRGAACHRVPTHDRRLQLILPNGILTTAPGGTDPRPVSQDSFHRPVRGGSGLIRSGEAFDQTGSLARAAAGTFH